MKKIMFTLMAIAVMGLSAGLTAADVSVKAILQKMDDLQTLKEDVTAKVSIVQNDAEQGKKLLEAIYFAKDTNDLFLIVMTKPEAEKGNGYLKSGDNFWMYRRNTRTFQHVNRDESIAGTDANAGDFEAPKYEKHYHGVKNSAGAEIIEPTKVGDIAAYRVEIRSDLPEVDYPKKVLWVRQDNFLPLKEQNYSLSGSLMNTQYFLQYTQINSRFIPVKQLVVDEFEKGNRTLWEITDIQFKPIESSVFTKAYLENLSK